MKWPRFALSVLFVPLAMLVVSGQPQGKKNDTIPHKTVTLQGQGIPLSKALKSLSQQTGIAVADRRTADGDPQLQLDLKNATFWQALDTVARKVGCSISLYQRDGVISLAGGAPSPVQPSHSGVFRSAVKRIDLSRDLEIDSHQCRLSLGFTWEPHFLPLYLEVKKYTATFAGLPGQPMVVTGNGKGWLDVHGQSALEVDNLLIPAPPRAATAISSLKGEFAVIGPQRMETLKFTNLQQAAAGTAAQQKVGKSTRVILKKLDVLDKNLWQAEIELHYPEGVPGFESYKNWTVNNKIWLQNIKNKDIKVPGRDEENIIHFDRAFIKYTFSEGKTIQLGQPAQWHLYYRTPDRIIQVTVPFEFKNVPLP